MRRFIIFLEDQGIGVSCDHVNWGMFGIMFEGRPDGMQPMTILALAPSSFIGFYELPEGRDWPDDIRVIYSEEEGRRILTNADTD